MTTNFMENFVQNDKSGMIGIDFMVIVTKVF